MPADATVAAPAAAAAPAPAQDDWGSPGHVHTLVMFAITAILLYLCYRMAVPFLSPLAWALALTIVMLPFHRLLERVVKHHGLAAVLSVVAAAITVVAPVAVVTSNIVSQVGTGAETVQARVESGEWRRALEAYPRLTPAVTWIDKQFDVEGSVKAASVKLGDFAGDFVRGSLKQAVQLVLTFYLLFYFLRDRGAALKSLSFLSPLSRAQMELMYKRLGDSLHGTIFGTFTVAIVQGTLGGLMFWWLGLPAPLLWGVVMGLMSLIPILGTFVIWVPAALFLLLTGQAGKAAILFAWGVLVVSSIDNILYPTLVGKRIHQHTILVFIAVIGGLVLFGAAGLILGPLVLTATASLLEIWRHPNQEVVVLSPSVPAVPDTISPDAPGNGEAVVR